VTDENCIRKLLNSSQTFLQFLKKFKLIISVPISVSMIDHRQCIFRTLSLKWIYETNFFRSHFVNWKINIINQKYFINNFYPLTKFESDCMEKRVMECDYYKSIVTQQNIPSLLPSCFESLFVLYWLKINASDWFDATNWKWKGH
jgi:hypothetical protein